MMHKAWSSIEEVPYCFSRSYVKLQGHTALKIVEFDPNWAFPDCNSSLNSPMAMKCCTKLETAKERCPIVFQGHPSNFKVTRYKTSLILTQIGRFRTIGRSQLSNPSDLPCFLFLVSFGHRLFSTNSVNTRTTDALAPGFVCMQNQWLFLEICTCIGLLLVLVMQHYGTLDQIDGEVQNCCYSSALAMELLQSCAKPSECSNLVRISFIQPTMLIWKVHCW